MNKFGMLVVGGLLSLGAFAADEGVTLGGYVDAGYNSFHQKDSTMSGFLVREGGVYVGKKFGEWQVFGDFMYDGSDIGVSQAFLSTSMDNGLSWKLGKFDGLFGAYAGQHDAWTHRLISKGLLQGYTPDSHTGWTGSYSLSDMLKVSALVANNSNSYVAKSAFNQIDLDAESAKAKAHLGTRNPDLGVVVNADLDAVKADVGALFTTGGNGTAESELGYSVTANVHGKFSGFDLGVFGLYNKADVKDAKSDFGVGVNVGHDLTNKLALNARGEYLNTASKSYLNPVSGDLEGTDVKNVMLATVGAQWKFSDAVKARLDYSYLSVKADKTVDPVSAIQAGVVANF